VWGYCILLRLIRNRYYYKNIMWTCIDCFVIGVTIFVSALFLAFSRSPGSAEVERESGKDLRESRETYKAGRGGNCQGRQTRVSPCIIIVNLNMKLITV